MNNRKLVTRVCERCGTEMKDVDPLRKYCLDCNAALHKEQARESDKRRAAARREMRAAAATATVKVAPKAPPKSIAQVCIEARQAKMSYGQYVARMGK